MTRDFIATEGPRVLPVFRGYTVDERLREFRRVEYGHLSEYVPFESPRGEWLLAEWRRYQKLASAGLMR
jgi:hypothetical protein